SNLARLVQSGIRVPPGFCLGVDAYRVLSEACRIDDEAQQLLQDFDPNDFGKLASISESLQGLIRSRDLQPEVERQLLRAYDLLLDKSGDPKLSVAVRSSATAEDLPEHSFTGQHDSYLGVRGYEDLIERVKHCWASLWNPQAIHYRQVRGYRAAPSVYVRGGSGHDSGGLRGGAVHRQSGDRGGF
ncbi:MAG: PEP/pyruvate-binding domain-containing protein, partial [Dehalococcoidia bacterium]